MINSSVTYSFNQLGQSFKTAYKMATRQLNIKNRSFHFYNDLINILNFEANNLKLDKKTSLGLDIYYIGYVDRKPEWQVNSVNPLYLMINRFYGTISKKIVINT